jgi:hypothetical protein
MRGARCLSGRYAGFRPSVADVPGFNLQLLPPGRDAHTLYTRAQIEQPTPFTAVSSTKFLHQQPQLPCTRDSRCKEITVLVGTCLHNAHSSAAERSEPAWCANIKVCRWAPQHASNL